MLVFYSLLVLSTTIPELNLLPQEFYLKNQEAYEFVAPSSIIQSGTSQWVLDVGEGVLLFDGNGYFQRKIFAIGAGPEEISPQTCFMAIDQRGRILIPDTFNGRIQLFDPKTNQYQSIRNQKIDFVVNAIPIGDRIWIGGINKVFEMNTDMDIQMTMLSHDFQSINLVGQSPGDGVFAVSMVAYGDCDKLCMFTKTPDHSFKKKYLDFEKTREIQEWAKKFKVPMILTGMVVLNDYIIFSTKICNQERAGMLLFLKKGTEHLNTFYLEGIELPILFDGGSEKYLIDANNATIFRLGPAKLGLIE